MTTPHDETNHASLIRARREMRRAYARDYGNETEAMIPQTEPVSFAPRSDDDAQIDALSDHHAVDVQMALERGLFYGFCACLVMVAGLTVALLAAYK